MERFVRAGNLRLTTADGSSFIVGRRNRARRLRSGSPREAAELGILLDPEVKLGEAYMDGTVVIEQGSIADVLAIRAASRCAGGMPPLWARTQWLLRYLHRRLQQFNPRRRARRNVAHHYDLDGRLYALFLDADRQYSCAYFETPDQSLDDAQLAKKRHLAAKLLVTPGQRVLDIGCGWGGLALYLAEIARRAASPASRCRRSSLRCARVRAAEKGLSGTRSNSGCRTIAT